MFTRVLGIYAGSESLAMAMEMVLTNGAQAPYDLWRTCYCLMLEYFETSLEMFEETARDGVCGLTIDPSEMPLESVRNQDPA